MKLSEQQQQAVRTWVAAGLSLSDVQKNLKSEFNVTMTFMDVRLLVLDLGAAVQDKPEPKPAPVKKVPEHVIEEEDTLPEEETPDAMAESLPPQEDTLPEDGANSSVTMTMDSLVVPGAMVSGNVTFSDGTKARWLIDQYGRFGIEPETLGYRPSPADLQVFQVLLRQELQRKGYA